MTPEEKAYVEEVKKRWALPVKLSTFENISMKDIPRLIQIIERQEGVIEKMKASLNRIADFDTVKMKPSFEWAENIARQTLKENPND